MNSNKIILDKYEKSIENALAKGKYVPTKNLARRKKIFAQAAKNFRQLQKSKPVTTRVNQEDLLKLKARAQRSGVHYQTLLSALIHSFVEGKIGLSM